ncbi:kinase-like protein [Thelephora ganbajun]|uniref:Kinase-like protein n=1 Tax=Thelephora ganbajun TaxID=370292 RepID=A0ACB6Z9I4_THEGA|nr:kinase-like protein [Thelephora ganbajun]
MAKIYQQLWKAVTDASGEAKAVRILAEILADKEGRDFISHLKINDAKLCIEILDRGIAKHNLKITEKQDFFVTLRRLAARHGRLPDSVIITDKIEVEDKILASGGFADVRSGSYKGHRVAVKTLKVAMNDDVPKIRKQFCKEVVLWSTLSHPNVLKFAGVQGDMEEGQFITVSEWMTHGNIMEYIRKNPVNRLELLHGAARGLEYLHGANLIHGDLKGANILMSNDTPPRACLADFGFMTMVLDPNHPMSCSTELEGGTAMFMSPELLAPKKFGMESAKPTTQADIYAFGLVVFQVLTGEIPFRGLGSVGFVFPVVEGLRPAKPKDAFAIGFSDSLWDFVQRCWDADMKLRPEVMEVVTNLDRAATDWDGVMSPCAQTKDLALDSNEPISASDKHHGIFKDFSSIAPENTTVSQVTSVPFSQQSTSTQRTELPQEPQAVVTPKPPNEPELKPWVPMSPRQEEGNHELRYLHLGQSYKSPPSQLPQKKWTSFKFLKSKFRAFFGLSSPR